MKKLLLLSLLFQRIVWNMYAHSAQYYCLVRIYSKSYVTSGHIYRQDK